MTDEELLTALKNNGDAAKVISCPNCGSNDVKECGDGHYHCQSCDTTYTLTTARD